jgi:hypothetical protein
MMSHNMSPPKMTDQRAGDKTVMAKRFSKKGKKGAKGMKKSSK